MTALLPWYHSIAPCIYKGGISASAICYLWWLLCLTDHSVGYMVFMVFLQHEIVQGSEMLKIFQYNTWCSCFLATHMCYVPFERVLDGD